MSLGYTDGIFTVRPLGGWLYVTWDQQSRKTFPHFVRMTRRLEKIAGSLNAKGLILDTALDNFHVQRMLTKAGCEPYEVKDGLIAFKKEVRHV